MDSVNIGGGVLKAFCLGFITHFCLKFFLSFNMDALGAILVLFLLLNIDNIFKKK